jgi:hypothetical protein
MFQDGQFPSLMVRVLQINMANGKIIDVGVRQGRGGCLKLGEEHLGEVPQPEPQLCTPQFELCVLIGGGMQC